MSTGLLPYDTSLKAIESSVKIENQETNAFLYLVLIHKVMVIRTDFLAFSFC